MADVIENHLQSTNSIQDDAHLPLQKAQVRLASLRSLPSVKARKYQDGMQEDERVTLSQLATLLHRLAVFIAAMVYIATSTQAGIGVNIVLRAEPLPQMDFDISRTKLMAHWAGNTTIRESPLFDTLGQVTTPLPGKVLYLENETQASFAMCTAPLFNSYMYTSPFLEAHMSGLLQDASYSISELRDVELILPVVDCTLTMLLPGDPSLLRVFYLVRKIGTPEDVFIVPFSLSMQDFKVPLQKQVGPAGVATLQFVNDMRVAVVNHYFVVAEGYPFKPISFKVYNLIGVTSNHLWELQSVPANTMLETPKVMTTARRSGFYINAETEQVRLRNKYWQLDDVPANVLGRWRWLGGPVLYDSWGWVHGIHGLFALDTIFNIIVLFLVIYRNLVQGKLWIGDAFVSVSTTLMYRSMFILLTWVVNDFWTLISHCFEFVIQVTEVQPICHFPDIIHADFLGLFLGFASLVGSALRERIDPALAVLVFELHFHYRVAIARWFPALVAALRVYGQTDFELSVLTVSDVVAHISPLRLWTIHPVHTKSLHLIFICILPIFGGVITLIAYALLRKMYRHYYPEKLHIQRVSNYSDKSEILEALKSELTCFEMATGAALQSRLGVMSDYENCLYVKGVKYASADGIYCNGYVVMSDKFLVATTDLFSLVVMKIIRYRFKNIYIYDVNGTTVQKTARLVYPSTMSWSDFLYLNINMLS